MSVIELSKSSRAGCRFCKSKIQKDEARLGEEYEFSMGGSVRTGMRWFHLKCAIENFPDLVIQADVSDKVSKDVLEQLEEFKKKGMRSAFDIQGISEIENEETTVNVKGLVLKAMKPKLDIDDSLYRVEYPNVDGKFTYIMKEIGAEVHGHGQETSGQ